MSENERKLRVLLGRETSTTGAAAEADALLKALLAEHRAEVAAARDAALEEAVYIAAAAPSPEHAARRIGALRSQPAQAVPVAKVREVLAWAAGLRGRQGYGPGIIRAISKRLGVPLDAEPEKPADTRRECTCTGSCRGPEGLGEGWRCALGKETTAERPSPATCPVCGTEHYIRAACPWPQSETTAPESEQCEGEPDCGWHNAGPCKFCKEKQSHE